MIGGNIMAQIQTSTITTNEIREQVRNWQTVDTLTGWLDLSGGDSKYTTYNAKIQESTHVFVADYKPLSGSITAENCRLLIAGKKYDVTLIDNPMGLNKQWEIYLKYTGGQ